MSPAASHVNGLVLVLVHLIVYGSDLYLSSIHWISVKTIICYNNIVCKAGVQRNLTERLARGRLQWARHVQRRTSTGA